MALLFHHWHSHCKLLWQDNEPFWMNKLCRELKKILSKSWAVIGQCCLSYTVDSIICYIKPWIATMLFLYSSAVWYGSTVMLVVVYFAIMYCQTCMLQSWQSCYEWISWELDQALWGGRCQRMARTPRFRHRVVIHHDGGSVLEEFNVLAFIPVISYGNSFTLICYRINVWWEQRWRSLLTKDWKELTRHSMIYNIII